MNFIPHVYYELAADPAPPTAKLEIEYKGYLISKRHQYNLYEIIAPEGYDPPTQLQGQYTKLSSLRIQIDRYFEDHPGVTALSSYVLAPVTPKRGRPRVFKPLVEPQQVTEQLNAESSLAQ